MTTPGHGVRTRLFIAGRLAHEDWIAVDDNAAAVAAAVGALQSRAAEEADARGEVWMAELHDPEAPPGVGTVRFGTDPTMMRDPKPQRSVADALSGIAAHPYHRWLHIRADLDRRRN